MATEILNSSYIFGLIKSLKLCPSVPNLNVPNRYHSHTVFYILGTWDYRYFRFHRPVCDSLNAQFQFSLKPGNGKSHICTGS